MQDYASVVVPRLRTRTKVGLSMGLQRRAGFPFSVSYFDSSVAPQALADERVMAVIGFGSNTQIDTQDPRQLTLGLSELGERSTVEVWYSEHPLQTRHTNGIYCVYNEQVLLAHLLLDEGDYPDLDSATYAAYRRIFTFIQRQGYPYLLRVWNYFSDINFDQQGLERYRAFCLGRYRVLAEEMANFEVRLPAACAIGTQAGGLLVYFLAAKVPGIQIENPRQMSAFHYPPQYGPKSPSFSRSVMMDWGRAERHLYISGTASIVGHATYHAQDPLAQAQEIQHNLEALLEHAGRYARTQFQFSLLKIYVRPGIALAALRDVITRRFNPAIPLVFLQADICRTDLLVEIEGMAIGMDKG